MAAKGLAKRREAAAKRKADELAAKEKVVELRFGINKLKEQLDNLTRSVSFGNSSKRLGIGALAKEEDIVAASNPVDGACGVYFLVRDNKVIYVGQSLNVFQRIREHEHKNFDRYAYIPCDESMLDKLESLYIYFLMPPLNGHLRNGDKIAPLKLEAILGSH